MGRKYNTRKRSGSGRNAYPLRKVEYRVPGKEWMVHLECGHEMCASRDFMGETCANSQRCIYCPKHEWVEFETETKLKAKALLINGELADVKLISKVGRSQYYSCLNDAGLTAEERWPKKRV